MKYREIDAGRHVINLIDHLIITRDTEGLELLDSLLVELIGNNIIDKNEISYIEVTEYIAEVLQDLRHDIDPAFGKSKQYREKFIDPLV